MLRINLLGRRFMYMAIEEAQIATHFNWLVQKKFVLIVKKTAAFPWYRAYKKGPTKFCLNN